MFKISVSPNNEKHIFSQRLRGGPWPYLASAYVYIQDLLPADLPGKHTCSTQYLAHVEEDKEWPWNILWTDEAHFYFQDFVNTQNCCIWATENSFAHAPVPLHSVKVSEWYGLTISSISSCSCSRSIFEIIELLTTIFQQNGLQDHRISILMASGCGLILKLQKFSWIEGTDYATHSQRDGLLISWPGFIYNSRKKSARGKILNIFKKHKLKKNREVEGKNQNML